MLSEDMRCSLFLASFALKGGGDAFVSDLLVDSTATTGRTETDSAGSCSILVICNTGNFYRGIRLLLIV